MTFHHNYLNSIGNDSHHRTKDGLPSTRQHRLTEPTTVLWTTNCQLPSYQHTQANTLHQYGVTMAKWIWWNEPISCIHDENEEQRHSISITSVHNNMLSPSSSLNGSGFTTTFTKTWNVISTIMTVLEFESLKPLKISWLVMTDGWTSSLRVINYNYEAVQMAFLPAKQRASMDSVSVDLQHCWHIISYPSTVNVNDENGYIYDCKQSVNTTLGEDDHVQTGGEWLIDLRSST